MIQPRQQEGFSVVEMIISMMILSVGILAMGASTGHIMSQIQASELRTERMTAVRQSAEVLRGTAWDDLEATCDTALTDLFTDHMAVSCRVKVVDSNLKSLTVITTGPGFVRAKLEPVVVDSMNIGIARP